MRLDIAFIVGRGSTIYYYTRYTFSSVNNTRHPGTLPCIE